MTPHTPIRLIQHLFTLAHQAQHVSVTTQSPRVSIHIDQPSILDGQAWTEQFLSQTPGTPLLSPDIHELTFRSGRWELTLHNPTSGPAHTFKENLPEVHGLQVHIHLTPHGCRDWMPDALGKTPCDVVFRMHTQHQPFTLTVNGQHVEKPRFHTLDLPSGRVHLGDSPHLLALLKDGVLTCNTQLAAQLHGMIVKNNLPAALPLRESFGGHVGVHFESPDFEVNGQREIPLSPQNLVILEKLLLEAAKKLLEDTQNLILQHPHIPPHHIPFPAGRKVLLPMLEVLGYTNVYDHVLQGSTLTYSEDHGWIPAGHQELSWSGHPQKVAHPAFLDQVNTLFLQGKLDRPAVYQDSGALPDFELCDEPQKGFPLIHQVPEIQLGDLSLPYLVMHDNIDGNFLDGPLLVTTLSVEDTLKLMASDTEEGHNLLGQVSMAVMELHDFDASPHHTENESLPGLKDAVLAYLAAEELPEQARIHQKRTAIRQALHKLQVPDPEALLHLPEDLKSQLGALKDHAQQVHEALQQHLT